MKKLFLALFLIFPFISQAQGIAINENNALPNSNAILDVNSDSKGVLLPRLTTEQRTEISMAVPGLTVFDISTFSYWVYLGELNGGWHEVLTSMDRHWERTGTDIFTNNPGNVGIGIMNPDYKLSISDINPTIDLMHVGISKAFLQAYGNDLKIGTHADNQFGNLVLNTKGTDRVWIDETGKVGIGTDSPSSVLTINGIHPWIELKNAGVDKGYVWASGNDLKVGTNAGNTTGNLVFQTKIVDRMMIDENGKVGIGTSSPASNSILTINDNNPIIQLENNDVSKGFIQLVNDNLKIGTNLTNGNGKFIVRTNGSDRMTIDDTGDLYLNSPSPSFFLEKNGDPFLRLTDASGNIELVRSFVGDGGDFEIRNGGYGLFLHENATANIGSGMNPAGYTLSIEGKAIATDFTSLSIGSWPDYVFAEDYELNTIDEVKQFITTHKHLPNIPSAKEVEQGGIQLGDMSKRLMEKVEELTLYVIQLNDQNKVLQEQIDALNLKRN